MNKKFQLASKVKVDELEPYVDKILDILGHPEALATDESLISDFTCFFNDGQREEDLRYLSQQIGFDVFEYEYDVDIAEKMKDEKFPLQKD